jgi:hypothetical protein
MFSIEKKSALEKTEKISKMAGMNAGRGLDVLIEENVFRRQALQLHASDVLPEAVGVDVIAPDPDGYYRHEDSGWSPLPRYSTDIAAAWEVVLKFGATISGPHDDGTWICSCGPRHRYSTVNATSAPLAICLAVLKAGARGAWAGPAVDILELTKD